MLYYNHNALLYIDTCIFMIIYSPKLNLSIYFEFHSLNQTFQASLTLFIPNKA